MHTFNSRHSTSHTTPGSSPASTHSLRPDFSGASGRVHIAANVMCVIAGALLLPLRLLRLLQWESGKRRARCCFLSLFSLAPGSPMDPLRLFPCRAFPARLSWLLATLFDVLGHPADLLLNDGFLHCLLDDSGPLYINCVNDVLNVRDHLSHLSVHRGNNTRCELRQLERMLFLRKLFVFQTASNLVGSPLSDSTDRDNRRNEV